MWAKRKVDTNHILGSVKDLLLADGNRRNSETDEIGMEFELEGEELDKAYHKLPSKVWTHKTDGSLDETGREFTFNKALNRKDAEKFVTEFFDVFGKEAKIDNSDRCSTHMHLNFQHRSILQVYSFLTLFYVYEQALFKKFAPERMEGNSQRWCKAETLGDSHQNSRIKEYKKNLQNGVFNNSDRYYAMNTEALFRYGSIECRMLGGSSDAKKPLEWMNILLELYDYIKNNPRLTPSEIICNAEDWMEFTEKNFPKIWEAIKDLDGLKDMLQNGADMVQEYAFAVDWTPAKTAEPPKKARKVDPYRAQQFVPEYYPDEEITF